MPAIWDENLEPEITVYTACPSPLCIQQTSQQVPSGFFTSSRNRQCPTILSKCDQEAIQKGVCDIRFGILDTYSELVPKGQHLCWSKGRSNVFHRAAVITRKMNWLSCL